MYVALRADNTKSLVLCSTPLDLTLGNSSVFYRLNNGADLTQASYDVLSAFGDVYSGFVASLVLVVTYHQVQAMTLSPGVS